MANSYEVEILQKTEIHTLPGIWSDDDLRRLLHLMDMDDLAAVPPSELPDMVLMSLQDQGHQAAGEFVLEAVFGASMGPGVRQNLVDDLLDEEPWQDFSHVAQQRGIFIAVVLMYQAFTNRYRIPDALRLRFGVRPLDDGGRTAMDTANAAWLLRLLSAGMAPDAILRRLYADELVGGRFDDAAGIIWHLAVSGEGDAAIVEITSSRQWLEPLTVGAAFRAGAA